MDSRRKSINDETAPSNVGYFCTRSARLGPIVTHSAVNAAGRKGTLKLIYFL
jgi:hypothetical protein